MDKRDTTAGRDRRSFIVRVAALVIGGIVGLVPLLAGLATFFDPLRRRAGSGGFRQVTTLNALPEDGQPRRFPIMADQINAWNKYLNIPVGAVYLRRTASGQVEALNVTCPHAGCPVEFKAATKSYLCPCHDSKFNLDGSLRDPASPSPRGMDTLPVEIRNDHEVWVKFQNFEPGKAEKIAIA
jgi:quinol---cytochrome c reductase iron-sulfur subunit, bacillus type